MEAAYSDLADELGLEFHRADTVDLAVDIVVAIAQADVLDLGADLYHERSALDLEVLDHGDGVAVLQDVAHRVFLHGFIAGRLGFAADGPLMGAFRANQLGAIFVGVFGIAFRAGWHYGDPDRGHSAGYAPSDEMMPKSTGCAGAVILPRVVRPSPARVFPHPHAAVRTGRPGYPYPVRSAFPATAATDP